MTEAAASAWFDNPVIALVVLSAIGALIKVGYWIGQVNTDRETFKSFMQEVKAKIDMILERLPRHPPTVAGSSPMQLTDFGKKVATGFGAQQWAKETAPEFRDRSLGKEPFQVDADCQKYVEEDLDPHSSNRVDQCAYDFGIDRPAVLAALRVVLREEILKTLSNHLRRNKDEETWHICPNCPQWPDEDFIISWTEPTVGEHCDQCKTLKNLGMCSEVPSE